MGDRTRPNLRNKDISALLSVFFVISKYISWTAVLEENK